MMWRNQGPGALRFKIGGVLYDVPANSDVTIPDHLDYVVTGRKIRLVPADGAATVSAPVVVEAPLPVEPPSEEAGAAIESDAVKQAVAELAAEGVKLPQPDKPKRRRRGY